MKHFLARYSRTFLSIKVWTKDSFYWSLNFFSLYRHLDLSSTHVWHQSLIDVGRVVITLLYSLD